MNLCKTPYNTCMKILLGDIMYNQGLTIRQVAMLTGLPSSTIQKVMKENSNPTVKTLEKISIGLNIPFEELYTLDD